MQLIKKQIESIEESIETRRKLDETYRSNYLNSHSEISITNMRFASDTNAEFDYKYNQRELSRLLAIIEDPETRIVEDASATSIEIGTTFTAKFDDEQEEESFTLVENLIGLDGNPSYTSTESLFGQSVHHKMEGESFFYTVTNKKSERPTVISGTITSIKNTNVKSSPKEYTKTISK